MSFSQTIIASLLFFSLSNVFAENSARRVEINTYSEVLKLFNELDYTAEYWQSGVRKIPRLEFTSIPQRWEDQSPSMPVKDKKNIFFRLLAPGLLISNEKISVERKTLLEKMKNPDATEDPWVLALAKKYKVLDADGSESDADDSPDSKSFHPNSSSLNSQDLAELTNRVDVIPPSLSLAQAAEESSWGSSRFSIKGNALFGQHDYSGKGMRPKRPRKSLGNYGVARFDSPQASIESYALNLNTHRAYQRLRDTRARMRRNNTPVTGWELAKSLGKYSERGSAYIRTLHSIMSFNKLQPVDEAYLWDKGTIVLAPAP